MKMRILAISFVVACCSSIVISQGAMVPAYLRDLPSVERITREVRGVDEIDTAAKQSGALNQFMKLITDIALASGRNSSTVP
jgi:hypothetical protein